METIHNTMIFNYERETNLKNKDNMNELEQFLAILFGDGVLTLSEGAKPDKETALALIQGMVTNGPLKDAEITQLKADKENLSLSITAKDTEIEQLKADKPDAALVALGTSLLSDARVETIANYNKVVGETPDASIVTMLNSASHETLVALNKGYNQQLEEKFPLSCSNCGSHDVSRASSSKEVQESNSKEEVKDTQTSIAALRERKFRSEKQN